MRLSPRVPRVTHLTHVARARVPACEQDKAADDLPSNLYKIKFFGNNGYVLGSNGVLLKNV